MGSQSAEAKSSPREVPEPRPSSSVLLLSPSNEILLLHRVKTSTSYASAHVFPGGNLDPFHEGPLPEPASPERHRDGPAYRMGAIRETFEETGILLASRDGALVNLPLHERDKARKEIHENKVKFGDFLDSIGAVADTAGLLPFTRWITPASNYSKRFTTQMYLYMLPVSQRGVPSQMHVPTPDGGVEHTAALFAPAQTFLEQAAGKAIILFPPQVYLMTLLTRFLTGHAVDVEASTLHYMGQRKKLLRFLRHKLTAETDAGKKHRTAGIMWGDKVICPYAIGYREQEKRAIMALDKAGPELKGTTDGGDWERVVLVRFGKGGPSNVEVRLREQVLEEQRRMESEAKL